MRNQNAYLTGRMAEQQQQQRWNAFCQSGRIADYLDYRACCTNEDFTNADTSHDQGTRDPGNSISGC